jgi:aspartate/methionine/tyrosine aminotransferase
MKINDFKLEDFLAKYEFTVKYTLCSSDCESFNVKELLDLEKDSLENLNKLWMGYTETLGNFSLRKEISKLYSKITPDNIIVFAGAEEGIFVFMNALLETGNHVIVQFPAYQSLFEVANSIGCYLTKWLMKENDDWELDLEFLEQNVNKGTRCIIVNFPHNPTGHLISKEDLKKIVKIASDNNTYIFSDEVYRFSEYDKNERLPAVCDLYQKGVSLGVMSKSFGLPGLRIGWIATKDQDLYSKLASFKNYTTICNSALSEFFSILALRHKDYLLQRNLKLIFNNLKLLDSFFDKYRYLFKWIKPKAGSVAFPKIMINEDIEKFCADLIKEKSILLLPGTIFDFDNKHFRIGFGRKNMPEALDLLEEYVKKKY